jgi:thioesterase domain-containing protein
MEHPFVRDAAVLLVEGDGAGARLVAWVARAPGQSVDDHELRTLLRERLPEPMIPGAIVLMDELPRNTSDKIDRARLPPPPREVGRAASSDGAPASPIEELLVGIWATALGRDHVSVHDDFFDLGGHSILALKIIDLAARAGLNITTEQLLHHANVRDLAAAATMNIAERSEGSLVVLRREGTRPPLFLVHSTPGDLLGYVNLVHALGHDQPVYGLQSLGLVRPDAAHTTLEAMARHYLADVRRVSPHGPYFLGGWCYGGFVSVEMARLLCAEGEEVALVALLEAEAPRPRLVSHPRYYSARARAVLSMGPKGVIDLLKDRARHLWRDRNRTLRDHLVYEVNEGLLANRDTVVEQNMCAIHAYQPTYYDGHLTLFRATEVDGVAIPDPSMGWSALARSFEVHDVEGRHETILHRPQVNELARLLRAAMDRAGTRESARPSPTAA